MGIAFTLPVETLESDVLGTLNMLEALRFLKRPIRSYNVCSEECFSGAGSAPSDEKSPFRPPRFVTRKFLSAAFGAVGLEGSFGVGPGLFRPTDLLSGRADPAKADRLLGWKARHMVKAVLEAERRGS